MASLGWRHIAVLCAGSLYLGGCDPTTTMNDLAALGSQAANDKTLIEAVVRDLKGTAPAAPVAAAAKSPVAAQASTSLDNKLRYFETLYSDTIAAQHSLLLILRVGPTRANQQEVQDAADTYERAANRFLGEGIGEVTARYQAAKGLDKTPTKAPPLRIDRSMLGSVFHSDTKVRSRVMQVLTTNALTPWSEL